MVRGLVFNPHKAKHFTGGAGERCEGAVAEGGEAGEGEDKHSGDAAGCAQVR